MGSTLLRLLEGASDLITDVRELADHSVTGILPLSELTATVEATSPASAPDLEGLVLVGQLPPAPGRALLVPERGVGGAVGALREIEVHDKDVDAAWVIRGDDPGLLLALVDALRPLASRAPRVAVEDAQIVVRWARAVEGTSALDQLSSALALWAKAAAFRAAAT